MDVTSKAELGIGPLEVPHPSASRFLIVVVDVGGVAITCTVGGHGRGGTDRREFESAPVRSAGSVGGR